MPSMAKPSSLPSRRPDSIRSSFHPETDPIMTCHPNLSGSLRGGATLNGSFTVRPGKQGLYDPWFEHEACGLGFVVDMKGRKSHRILEQAIQVLRNLDHRGACGCEANTGDGAGVLLQIPHRFLEQACEQAHIAL